MGVIHPTTELDFGVQIMISKSEDDWWKTFWVVYLILCEAMIWNSKQNQPCGMVYMRYNCVWNFFFMRVCMCAFFLSLVAVAVAMNFRHVKLIHCVVEAGQFIVYVWALERTTHLFGSFDTLIKYIKSTDTNCVRSCPCRKKSDWTGRRLSAYIFGI